MKKILTVTLALLISGFSMGTLDAARAKKAPILKKKATTALAEKSATTKKNSLEARRKFKIIVIKTK